MNENIKKIVIIASLIFVAFGTYVMVDKVVYKKVGELRNNAEAQGTQNTDNTQNSQNSDNTQNSAEKNENKEENPAKSENKEDTNKKELNEIEISDAEIIDIFIDAKPFDDVEELSTDDILTIVYTALNRHKIVAYKNRGQGQETATYTEGEINGIVYSLFGQKLKENKSLGENFTYKDGTYTLVHTKRYETMITANNIESDVAAGTMYINYDLYYSVNGKNELKGSYAIGKSNITKRITCKKEM